MTLEQALLGQVNGMGVAERNGVEPTGMILEQSLAEHQDLLIEVANCRGYASKAALGEPASPAAIGDVEERLGFAMPDDYRRFLMLHDGWQSFSGDNDILSTRQMVSEKTRAWITRLQRVSLGTPAGNGFVVMGSPYTTTMLFYVAEPRSHGGHDLVYWRDCEIARYDSFADFLVRWKNMLKEELSELREVP